MVRELRAFAGPALLQRLGTGLLCPPPLAPLPPAPGDRTLGGVAACLGVLLVVDLPRRCPLPLSEGGLWDMVLGIPVQLKSGGQNRYVSAAASSKKKFIVVAQHMT